MNHLEAYELLKTRVEWKTPLNTSFSYLNFNSPESGRYLQEEHSSVRIPIIYETIVHIDITNTQFKDELDSLKKRAILQMLHDVFYDQKEIKEIWINENISLFDYAIILKNTSSVLFDILNSTRINLTEKFNTNNIKRWFIDLNGINDKENGVFVKGFISRYKREIERIRKVLFINQKYHKIVTAR
ncbi:hypothetical protein BTO06_09815 [Tenacibaculum sp. SZ-18]|uniref:hypothetical protein n=1 Tax=Tenacibaculum sp. SZ-18 TaxID=754423 RepID=UPI000C2D4B5E|nr:hypothetical protein [Tenacibaculum sp. SZ-18]AUC15416.1 hypothetical protein BTO06_09815 [Tenacibaculum sp. SZ-18]